MGHGRRILRSSWLLPFMGFVAGALAAARQAAAVPWVRSYDAPGVTIVTVDALADGRILMAGPCDTCAGGAPATWLALANADGTLAWQEAVPRASAGRDVRVVRAANGGWLVFADSRLLRLNADGSLAWAAEGLGVELTDVTVRGDGAFTVSGDIVIGRTPWGTDETAAWLAVLDDSGSVQQQRSFSIGNMGTSIQRIAGTAAGAWIAAVTADYDALMSTRTFRELLIRFDDAGQAVTQWQTLAPFNGSWCAGLVALQDGGCAAVLDNFTTSWVYTMAVVLDADATARRMRSEYWCSSMEGRVTSITQARDGALLLLADNCGATRLTREDASGQAAWLLDGLTGSQTMQVLDDGEILVPGAMPGASLARLSAGGSVAAPCLSLASRAGGDALLPWDSPPSLPTIVDAGVTAGILPLTITPVPTSFALLESCDNCPGIPSDQSDADEDLVGDACDGCPDVPDTAQADLDGDGIGDACDDCSDTDGDGLGATGAAPETCALDACPDVADPSNADSDGDGLGDACDDCPLVGDSGADGDRDGAPDACDACPLVRDDQSDGDGDGAGDACDACPLRSGDQSDADADAVGDACDDCPDLLDPDQRDTDGDGAGDLCDACPGLADDQSDADGDGAGDACDDCASPDPAQADCDGDGIGEACEAGDADGDGFANAADLCPCLFDASQRDRDADGIGDACDPCPDLADNGLDTDGDLTGDACDLCPFDFERAPSDRDGDGRGDGCDNCPDAANRAQEDEDRDGTGDACETATEVAPMDVDPFAQPVRLQLGPGVTLSWPDADEARYDVYRGTVPALAMGRYDHAPVACGVSSLGTAVPDEPGSFYYLVSSRDGRLESSLGRDSRGIERPGAPVVCP